MSTEETARYYSIAIGNQEVDDVRVRVQMKSLIL